MLNHCRKPRTLNTLHTPGPISQVYTGCQSRRGKGQLMHCTNVCSSLAAQSILSRCARHQVLAAAAGMRTRQRVDKAIAASQRSLKVPNITVFHLHNALQLNSSIALLLLYFIFLTVGSVVAPVWRARRCQNDWSQARRGLKRRRSAHYESKISYPVKRGTGPFHPFILYG